MARSSATATPPTERPTSSHMIQVAPIIAKPVSFCWMSMMFSVSCKFEGVSCCVRVAPLERQQPACQHKVVELLGFRHERTGGHRHVSADRCPRQTGGPGGLLPEEWVITVLIL